RLETLPGGEVVVGSPALVLARAGLASGRIALVKGIGGYQLACRADDSQVVARLRGLKGRPTQPFAVMVRDLEVARIVAVLCEADEDLLVSPQAPILLAPQRPGTRLATNVAPGLSDVGVMLPTTPLHVELFRDAPYDALVMTSGNARHEPIARSDQDALGDLSAFADLVLMHDREVVRRVDDSVARAGAGVPYLVRRSRGYVPDPLPLPCAAPVPVLALGGHLQVTACLGVGSQAILSQHVGDLDTCTARDFLEEVAMQLEQFLEARSELIVVDTHPDYASTWFGEQLAQQREVPILRIQHHLAHAAAVLAEHGAFPRSSGEHVASLVLDGTGFGEDGTTWGCEWLILNGGLAWGRVATGQALTLVGGERAVREPWRVASAALMQAGEVDLLSNLRPEWGPNVEALVPLLTGCDWPRARGAGRLFEAAGALFGLCAANSWEGEAAARLESLADSANAEGEPWSDVEAASTTCELPSASLLVTAARRLREGCDPAATALGFHRTFAALAAELSVRAFGSETRCVALGGGCLVNRHLRRYLVSEHRSRGLAVLLPRRVPAGDGGLAYGQAALAAAALQRKVRPAYTGGV
ncbi:MAG: Sua5/YciO/YrdC/YwlC family protein, partial [Planctomycetota bacterium]